MNKEEQKKILVEMMEEDKKLGLYKQQTAVELLISNLPIRFKNALMNECNSEIEKAKQREKEQMIDFAEYVARYPDKNRNYLGQMLHAKSKYDGAERTIDLLEQYYNETYGKDSN